MDSVLVYLRYYGIEVISYQAHESIAIILLLLSSTAIAPILRAELLAHSSVEIHDYAVNQINQESIKNPLSNKSPNVAFAMTMFCGCVRKQTTTCAYP